METNNRKVINPYETRPVAPPLEGYYEPSNIFRLWNVLVLRGKNEDPEYIDNRYKISEEQYRSAEIAISRAILKYPPEFFSETSSFSRVVIAKIKKSAGLAVHASGTIYIDPTFDSIEGCFHHEVQHFLDRTLEGRKFRSEWDRLFPRPGYLKLLFMKVAGGYIEQRRLMDMGRRDSIVFKLPTIKDKYYTDYGSKIDEDRTTIAELMFSEGGQIYHARQDEKVINKIIRDKMTYLMSFYHRLNSKMDVGYWADLAEGKVNSLMYWRNRERNQSVLPTREKRM